MAAIFPNSYLVQFSQVHCLMYWLIKECHSRAGVAFCKTVAWSRTGRSSLRKLLFRPSQDSPDLRLEKLANFRKTRKMLWSTSPRATTSTSRPLGPTKIKNHWTYKSWTIITKKWKKMAFLNFFTVLIIFYTVIFVLKCYNKLLFLKHFGIEISLFQIKWFTARFNRFFLKCGNWHRKFIVVWFSIGSVFSVLLIIPSMLLLVRTFIGNLVILTNQNVPSIRKWYIESRLMWSFWN